MTAETQTTSNDSSPTPIPDPIVLGDLDTENELIHHRLTWLLAGQPLLLLAYANVSTTKLAPGERFISDATRGAMVEWIPFVGWWSSLAVLVGVIAAQIAFTIILLRPPKKTFGVHWTTTVLGHIPPLAIPFICMVAWSAIASAQRVSIESPLPPTNGRFTAIEIRNSSGTHTAILDSATGELQAATLDRKRENHTRRDAEQSHALEPVVGPVSNGESPPPAQ